MVGLTNESVHVEYPMEGVDLGEGGDVHREASVGEYHSEHYCAFCLLLYVYVLPKRMEGFKECYRYCIDCIG